tara:strand:- start:2761 stop:3105 length:345 start_codon:yes stop_codon:yes gene_type:complete
MTTKKFKKPIHPMTLNIGYKSFQIVQASLEKDCLYGCVEFSKNTITIDPYQELTDYKGTLLHEILHVGFDMFGLGDDDEMPTITNEFITHITSNMFQLLQGLNPELFDFIISND